MLPRLMLDRAVFAAISTAFIPSLNNLAAKPSDRFLFVYTKYIDCRRIPGGDQPIRVDRKRRVSSPLDELSDVSKFHWSD